MGDVTTLVDRLRGKYTVPVNDGAGLLDGKDTFTRYFETPPIHHEAAAEIERLRLALETSLSREVLTDCENEAVRADNTRLRAVLLRCLNWVYLRIESNIGEHGSCINCTDIPAGSNVRCAGCRWIAAAQKFYKEVQQALVEVSS